MDLKVFTYNCRGLPKSKKRLSLRPDIGQIFDDAHIVAFQETWFSKQDLNCLNSLHDNYFGFGVAKVDESLGLIQGRYSGGVAIMWKKELSRNIKVLDLNVNWCIAIEFDVGCTRFVLFNIYMPYQTIANEDEYIEKLGYIKCFIDELNCTNYAIIGDWNANLGNSGTMTFKAPMMEFCRDNELFISSQILLPDTTYTHINTYEGNLYYSWLDHVVSSHDFHKSINNIAVLKDMSDDDHIPVCFSLKVDHLPATSDDMNDITAKIKWEAITDENKKLYHSKTHENLGRVLVPVSAVSCSNASCEEKAHKIQLEQFYNDTVSGLQVSSKQLAKCELSKFNKPGWSDYVSDLYRFSRDTYKLWLENGKPRGGPIHDIYAQSKCRFKYACRFIKKHEDDLRRESIAKKLSENNPKAM